MDTERLIEEIRKFPVLYDQSNENYRNTEFKELIWKKISSNLQVKGGMEECKKRWASIRDQFRRTLSKRKTLSGQAEAKMRKYKYEDLLTFLIPYIVERETLSKVSLFLEEEEKTFVEESTIEESSMEEPLLEVEKSSIEDSSTADSRQRKKVSQKRKLSSRQKEDSPANQLMAYLIAEKKAEAIKTISEVLTTHPVDAFLSGIAPTLKSLSPKLLNQAKTKIFSVVQEFELKQIESDSAGQQQFHPSSLSPLHSPVLLQMRSAEDQKSKT